MRSKNILLAFVLGILSVTLLPSVATADHFAAADLYVTYVGVGIDGCTGTAKYEYEVTFDEYRPCDPGNAPLSTIEYINISSATAGGPPIQFMLTNPEIDTLDQLCDTFKSQNSCRIPVATQPLGFIRNRFKGLLTLPSAQTDWIFSWNSCCTTIPLLNVPNFQPIWIECMLNNVVKYNNSTPRFLIDPLPYLCTNQPATFLNGPYDLNNDSMETYNTGHYTTSTATLVYLPGYSLQDPIMSAASNPFRVNKFTGTATFTPTLAGRFTLNFQCDEYDRKTGVRTAYIRRDVETNVLNCTVPPPTIDTLPPTLSGGTIIKGKTLIACPKSNINFTIAGKASGATSKIYLEASNTIPGSNFSVTGAGGLNPTGTFTWTPTTSDYGEHTIIITTKDSTCSGSGTLIVQKNYTVILIKIIKGLDAGPDLPVCRLNPSAKQLAVNGAEDLTQIMWQDISGGPAKNLSASNIVNPIATPTTTTTYVVYSPELVDQCKSRDTVVVYEDKTNELDIFPQTDRFVMCRPGYLQLDLVAQGKGPLNNIPCGLSSQVVGSSYDSLSIYGSPVYGAGFSYDTVGDATPILHSAVRSTRAQFIMTRQEMKAYGLLSSTLTGLSFETVKNTLPVNFEYSNLLISLKCTNKTALSKATGFETGMTPVYNAPGPTIFDDGSHKFIFNTPYDWDTTQNLIIEICYSNNPAVSGPCIAPATAAPPVYKFMPTTYPSTLELKAPDNIVLSVCGVNNATALVEKLGRPVFQFYFVDAPALPFQYNWYPGAYLSDSTVKQPLAYVPKTTNYMVELFGRTGCRYADTLQVYVPVHDYSVFPKDTAICFGESAPLEAMKGTYYQWFEFENGQYKSAHESLSCDRCPNPVAKPKKTTHYKIVIGDDVFCYDTIDAYIEVRPLPLVNIITNDTTVKYGQSLQLLVNGARLYNWTPVSSLNNPNISYPVATPTEATMYVVAGLGTNGCRAYDTVRVGIDYRDNLFIPSAFSPNGDGKNDMFRIANMTFQRIIEFRVFNRWGQEIFSGNDPKMGWDGTWRGVQQEVGNYQYMIRVASPDGNVETYKGDVSLLR